METGVAYGLFSDALLPLARTPEPGTLALPARGERSLAD
jgi:hypothetical protein